jgi:hypothetical protein
MAVEKKIVEEGKKIEKKNVDPSQISGKKYKKSGALPCLSCDP